MIVWNTLEAPAVWDVGETEYKGNILLSNSNRTLLGIYFSDYVYYDEDLEKDFVKEAEGLTVKSVPATNIDLEDRQIELVHTDLEEDGWTKFEAAFSGKSKDDTYKKGDVVYATVPEEVCADLESLLGKEVTVLFGEDEIVALIMVTNDALVDGAFVEEYNADEDEVTIAGVEYEFATEEAVEVYVNNVELTAVCVEDDANHNCVTDEDDCEFMTADEVMELVVSELGEEFEEKFDKKVMADVILNEDDEIIRLDMYVSATVAAFHSIEAIVTDVDDEEFEYAYVVANSTTPADGDYDYSKIKADKLPNVKVNGEKADIEDIEVGNVILLVYGDKGVNDVRSINVTTNTVAGEVTRTKKDGNILTIDGTQYPSSIVDYLAVTDEDIDDADFDGTGIAGTTIEKGDEVTLYVNAFGEIVVASTDNAGEGSDWEFAYVRSIKDVDEDDNDDFVATLKLLLLADGTKTTYSVVIDPDDYKPELDPNDKDLDTKIEVFEAFIDEYDGKVIAFKANADKEITLDELEGDIDACVEDALEDLVIITDSTIALDSNLSDAEDLLKDFAFAPIAQTDKVDDDYEEIKDTYDFKKSSVIVDLAEEAIYTRWKAMIDDDELVGDAIVICKNDETDIKYIIFADTETASTDSIYALYTSHDTDEVNLTAEEKLTLEHDDKEDLLDTIEKGAFVEYEKNSKNELDAIKMLIDVEEFTDRDNKNDIVTDAILTNGKETKLAVGIANSPVIETEAEKGAYALDAAFEYKADAAQTLAIYTIEGFIPADLDGITQLTIVQENEALKLAYGAEGLYTNGVRTNTYAVGTEIVEGDVVRVLLADGKDVVVKLYEGGEVKEDKLIATYTINDPVVKEVASDDDVEVADKEVSEIAATPLNYEVEEVSDYKLTYVDIDGVKLGTVKVDKDETTVYDLRDGGFKVVDYKDIKDNLKGELVIPFKTAECDDGAQANILVVVELENK